MVVPESSQERSCSKESSQNVPSTITISESALVGPFSLISFTSDAFLRVDVDHGIIFVGHFRSVPNFALTTSKFLKMQAVAVLIALPSSTSWRFTAEELLQVAWVVVVMASTGQALQKAKPARSNPSLTTSTRGCETLAPGTNEDAVDDDVYYYICWRRCE